MNITVRIDKNYGREAIYPACDVSQIFADMAGTKTISRRNLRQIEALGYSITIHEPSLNLERRTTQIRG